VNIHLDGGPPQHETIDPKPDAPEEIRGPFRPISTKVPGFQISELMPKLATIADRFAFVRSITGSAGAHDAFQCQSGFPEKVDKAIGGRPAMGSIVARLQGSPDEPVPPFVDLMQGRGQVRNSARPGYLGPSYTPFRPDLSAMFPRRLEEGMKKEILQRGPQPTFQLAFAEGLDARRLEDRRQLLAGFDDTRRDLDSAGGMEALDRFGQQAVNILTSGRLAEAIDLGREPAKGAKKYELPAVAELAAETTEGPGAAKKLLLARRLLEAGVRCVSVSFSDFDTHSKNFPRMKQLVPIVDHALHAFVTDLEERGMLNDVAIVVWGEFGRSPRVNKDGGRDHWPEAGPALLAGGGLRGGQVIGATDRLGGKIASRPVSFEDVFATLYRTLGIEANSTALKDPSGRPHFILDRGDAIRELF
jgi:hypothetical protein